MNLFVNHFKPSRCLGHMIWRVLSNILCDLDPEIKVEGKNKRVFVMAAQGFYAERLYQNIYKKRIREILEIIYTLDRIVITVAATDPVIC